MEGYSEPTRHKVGQSRMEIIISAQQTIRPGYFLFTIPHNSKSHNHKMRYGIITETYVDLELELI